MNYKAIYESIKEALEGEIVIYDIQHEKRNLAVVITDKHVDVDKLYVLFNNLFKREYSYSLLVNPVMINGFMYSEVCIYFSY